MTHSAANTRVGSPAWRAEALRRQRDALPACDRVTLSCSAPFGTGGLGRHLEELAAAFAARGARVRCICEGAPFAGSAEYYEMAVPGASLAGRGLRLLEPLGRISPALRARVYSAGFDADAARLVRGEEALIGFNGTSLMQLRAARTRGQPTALVSATLHLRRLLHSYEQARARHPIERSWPAGVLARTLREYELAETIYVSSPLAWESFVDEGVAEERLRMFPLTPSERYQPDPAATRSETFDVVYAGAVSIEKGVPVLVDAVRGLPHEDLRLRLIGGWRTRQMRRFMQGAMRDDPRITVEAGDPLPVLQVAGLYVHASWGDGFAYAAAEAMACGVPVVVSEGTGMKDLLARSGSGAGLVVPTGDIAALAEAIDAAYRGALKGGTSGRPAAEPTL
jgi:glycosyltransferase involved in cell wall biosynthesis